MTKLLQGARVVVLALALVAVYPVIMPLLKGQMGWDEAVSVIASDKVVWLLVAAALIGFFLTLSKNKTVRGVSAVVGVALVILVIQGVIPLNPLKAGANAYAFVGQGAEAAERCGYKMGVENTGENVRAVLRDPARGMEIVGYVAQGAADAVGTVIDPNGNVVNLECR